MVEYIIRFSGIKIRYNVTSNIQYVFKLANNIEILMNIIIIVSQSNNQKIQNNNFKYQITDCAASLNKLLKMIHKNST